MVSPKIIIGLLIFILFVHILATIYYWYWTVGWLDMPMHFLGGFWLAIVFVWLNSKFDILKFNQENRTLQIITTFITFLSLVVLVGVFWELFEFLYDIFISPKGYFGVAQLGVADTMSDLFFDILGGSAFLIVYHCFLKFKFRQNKDYFLE